MPFLPVAERELRVASRRPSTYRIRAVAVAIGLVVVGWKLLEAIDRGVPANAQGRVLFPALTVLAFFYCLLAGAFVTSDCLSEEKREGTLGLLFLTDLKGYDVVIGKLVASSMNAVYGLVAIIPMLALTLLLGGVTIWQVAFTALTLLITLMLSLSVGILVSSHHRNERKAVFFTLVTLLVVVVTPMMIGVPILSPAFSILNITGQLRGFSQQSFWISLAIMGGLTILFLRLASHHVPKSWHDKQPKVKAIPPRSINRPTEKPVKKVNLAFRRESLDRNPFLWLALRFPQKKQHAWMFVIAMIVIWGMGNLSDHSVMFDPLVLVPWTVFVFGFLKIWIAYEATNRLVQDRKSGALELMLCTPLDEKEIVRGQWLALMEQFRKPLILLFAFELLLMWKGEKFGWIGFLLMSVFVVDFFAIGWVSMWSALTAKGLNRAVMKTVLFTMAIPTVIALAAIPLTMTRPRYWREGEWTTFWWFASMIAGVILAYGWAKPRVLTHFRDVASRQFQAKVP